MQRLQQLDDKFYALSTREKVLVLCAAVVLILFGSNAWLIEPLSSQAQALKNQLQEEQATQARFVQQINDIKHRLTDNQNQPLQHKLRVLQTESAKLDQQLQQDMGSLVPANKMPALLKQMLSEQPAIKLVSLQSMPVLAIGKDDQSKTVTTRLYRHGVKLVLEGNYFAILTYVKQLSASPWHFYWQKFDYDVVAYPTGRVQLELYTLSTNTAFIGI